MDDGEQYKRQVGLINILEFRDNPISIIGCGAIGSFVGISLAKMGLTKFILYDDDTVEEHNLPNQFFSKYNLGSRKITALDEKMVSFNGDVKITAVHRKFKSDDDIKSIVVISCVDTMAARKLIFEKVKKSSCQLFIDTRMSGLQGQVYCIDMTKKRNIKYYEKTLYSDSEVAPGRCTERSIIFTVLGIASIVCNQIVKAFKGEEIKQFTVLDYITGTVY